MSQKKIKPTDIATRKICSRFLWNLYTDQNEKIKKTKYSENYRNRENARSPIEDVEISDKDFDAIMGSVENELIDLVGIPGEASAGKGGGCVGMGVIGTHGNHIGGCGGNRQCDVGRGGQKLGQKPPHGTGRHPKIKDAIGNCLGSQHKGPDAGGEVASRWQKIQVNFLK